MENERKEKIVEDDTKAEQVPNEADGRDGLITWIKTHKNQLILVGISIPTIVAVVLGLKNKDAIEEVWDNLKEAIKESNLYSPKWFETATDDVLNAERERVRLDYCSSGNDFAKAVSLQNLLLRFDKELSKRAWGDEIPHAPSIHREQGWYLPNDD